MADLYLLGIRRLAKKGGVNKISRDALEFLRDITEKIVIEISKRASESSKIKNKKIVEKEDIKEALKSLNMDSLLS